MAVGPDHGFHMGGAAKTAVRSGRWTSWSLPKGDGAGEVHHVSVKKGVTAHVHACAQQR